MSLLIEQLRVVAELDQHNRTLADRAQALAKVPGGSVQAQPEPRWWDPHQELVGVIHSNLLLLRGGDVFVPDGCGLDIYGADISNPWFILASRDRLRRVVFEYPAGRLEIHAAGGTWAIYDPSTEQRVAFDGAPITYQFKCIAETVCRTGVVWVGPECNHVDKTEAR